jgi:Tol biopolymer transport system component
LEDPNISEHGQLAAGQLLRDLNIWRLELKNGSTASSHLPQLAIASTRDEADPAISPDGSQIPFASNRGGYGEVLTLRLTRR